MKHSRSGILLMEMILVILFFAIASCVCARLFVKAHLTRLQTIRENHAVIEAQNLAENWISMNGSLENAVLYFDDEWLTCSGAEASYVASLSNSSNTESGLAKADIVVSIMDNGAPIYTLEVYHHIALRRDDYDTSH